MFEENTNLFCPIPDFDPSLYKSPLKSNLLWHLNRPLFEVVRTPLVVSPWKEKVSSLIGWYDPAWSPSCTAAQQANDRSDPVTSEAAVSYEWNN